MGARGQCPLKGKKFCHLEVKFAVFWHKKTTTDVLVFLVNFVVVVGQNVLLAEIRDIAEKDIACVRKERIG